MYRGLFLFHDSDGIPIAGMPITLNKLFLPYIIMDISAL